MAVDGDLKALTSALDHARAMANFAGEVRTNNFNFFVLITGGLVTGYANLPSGWRIALELGGVVSSLLFILLDVREYGLTRRSVDQLLILEPLVWQRAGLTGWKPIPLHGGIRVVSYRWIYRTFFAVIGVGWFLALAISHLRP